MLRILCAPDKFKGTLSAWKAAQAMCRGAQRAGRNIEAIALPIGDGGEGTLDVLAQAMGAELRSWSVTGPLGGTVQANFGWVRNSRTAIVELAHAAGLLLVPDKLRDPMRTTSFGAGQLIQHALELGAIEVLIALGGSATVDGGCGMLQALGAQFFAADGAKIEQPITGGMLTRIARVVPPIQRSTLIALCDVSNPLLGEHGAARVYGPQKGATAVQIEQLEQGLEHLAAIMGSNAYAPRTGAAGGAAFGLHAVCGASLQRGIDVVLHRINFQERCAGVDLVLTGEGRLDDQSLQGKACIGVAQAAHQLGVPAVAIVGSTGPHAEDAANAEKGGLLRTFVSLADEFGEARAMREPEAMIEIVAERLAREWKR